MSEWTGRWAGRTVACIASGPSLTADDCEAVRQAGLPTIVTNTTFRLCPWADVLMAFDGKWWAHYADEVQASFKGQRIACSKASVKYGATNIGVEKWFKSFNNSGAAAIALAAFGGADRIVLLGYDCQKTGGKTHHHGDHPAALSNARSIGNWPTHFKNVARFAAEKGTAVVNCTRETALKCFERSHLAAELQIGAKE